MRNNNSHRTTKRLVPITVGADSVHVSSKTIRRRIADGSLTGYRLGPRLIRIDLDELDALMRPMPTAAIAGGAA